MVMSYLRHDDGGSVFRNSDGAKKKKTDDGYSRPCTTSVFKDRGEKKT